MKRFLRVADGCIIVLALMAASCVVQQEGLRPWWTAFFWLFVVIVSRLELIMYRKVE